MGLCFYRSLFGIGMCYIENNLTKEEPTLKQHFLTQKFNFQNDVSVQQGSWLPILIQYTIRAEILPSFNSTYLRVQPTQ